MKIYRTKNTEIEKKNRKLKIQEMILKKPKNTEG